MYDCEDDFHFAAPVARLRPYPEMKDAVGGGGGDISAYRDAIFDGRIFRAVL